MEFCPKCGSLMMPKRSGDSVFLICSRCGFSREVSSKGSVEESSYIFRRRIKHTVKEKMVVIDETTRLPRIASIVRNVECPRCGNREAYAWMMQTRAADEPPTRFYRCTKCGYTWREYE